MNITLMSVWLLILLIVCVLITQLCPTLAVPWTVAYEASVDGILQARILECVAIPFSRGSSKPRDQTQVSCIAGRFLTIWATVNINLR